MKNFYIGLLCLLPLVSCSQNKPQDAELNLNHGVLPQQSFSTLKFEADGKPCIALINNRYIEFKDKKKFPLSFFIMVNTLNKKQDGHPDEKETLLFNSLQTEIIQELNKVLKQYCYIGTTTMAGYRDILLYIKAEDQEKATEALKSLKAKNQRINTLSLEIDHEWEAVASFYEAIAVKD